VLASAQPYSKQQVPNHDVQKLTLTTFFCNAQARSPPCACPSSLCECVWPNMPCEWSRCSCPCSWSCSCLCCSWLIMPRCQTIHLLSLSIVECARRATSPSTHPAPRANRKYCVLSMTGARRGHQQCRRRNKTPTGQDDSYIRLLNLSNTSSLHVNLKTLALEGERNPWETSRTKKRRCYDSDCYEGLGNVSMVKRPTHRVSR